MKKLLLCFVLLCCRCLAGNVTTTNAVPSSPTTLGNVVCDSAFVRSQIPTNAVIVRAFDRAPAAPKVAVVFHTPSATNYSTQTFYGTNGTLRLVWKRPDHQ